MAHDHQTQEHASDGHHIVSYREQFGTWIALIILTALTVGVSVFGADLRTLSVATALLIATVKALVVAFYFMHLKYDRKIYLYMVLIVMLLFVAFLILVILDYLLR